MFGVNAVVTYEVRGFGKKSAALGFRVFGASASGCGVLGFVDVALTPFGPFVLDSFFGV